MYIKEEKKKKDSKRKRIRSKNYFHIFICVRNKFKKIPRLLILSLTLHPEVSLNIYICNNNSKITPNNFPQIQNFISPISYHSINPRTIEFKFFSRTMNYFTNSYISYALLHQF